MLIQKDDHKIEVSPDAYKSMYKRLGYQVIKDNKRTNKRLDEKKNENNSLDENKPLDGDKPLDENSGEKTNNDKK